MQLFTIFDFVYGSRAFSNPVNYYDKVFFTHLMCREWHAITMMTFSHLLTTTVVSTAPNTRVQLTHLSNLTLLYREYDDIYCNTALYNNHIISISYNTGKSALPNIYIGQSTSECVITNMLHFQHYV